MVRDHIVSFLGKFAWNSALFWQAFPFKFNFQEYGWAQNGYGVVMEPGLLQCLAARNSCAEWPQCNNGEPRGSHLPNTMPRVIDDYFQEGIMFDSLRMEAEKL